MTTETKLRRGTATQCDAFTGAEAELVVDTTNDRLRVHDGIKVGGFHVPNHKDVQQQVFNFCTVGGSANSITLTSVTPISAYASPLKLTFKATATNTGAAQVNVDGKGLKDIYKVQGTSVVALTGGEIISGAIYDITYDGVQFQLTNGAGGGIASVKQQIFSTSGTYTPSAGMLYCYVEVQGAGGGGGSASGGYGFAAAGANSGAYGASLLTAATIGASQAVTIGAGGAGGTAGGNGSAGGTSSLGAIISCAGGAPSLGVVTVTAPTIKSPAETIAAASGASTQIAGTQGSPAIIINTVSSGGYISISGKGADSKFGTGGVGLSARGTSDALAQGAGGAGGQCGNSTSAANGGSGGGGRVVITEYCSQ